MKSISCLAVAAALLASSACQPSTSEPGAAAAHSPASNAAATVANPTITADVVQAATAFIATLSASQRDTLLQKFTAGNAAQWSNLPTSFVTRLGLKLSDLDSTQTKAALAVVRAATGTAANEGYDEIQ